MGMDDDLFLLDWFERAEKELSIRRIINSYISSFNSNQLTKILQKCREVDDEDGYDFECPIEDYC